MRKGKNTGVPKNAAERAFYELVKDEGWSVTKRGWPDFFVETENGGIICVEVKPYANVALKPSQLRILKALAAYGVPCYLWSPDVGFTEIKP